ncbi:MAG: arsenate reductase ArsC [Methylococcales bacterium]|nr:arsenate reductase ArsC [Methylococcales bacterium]
MLNILVICTGNSCRSLIGEALFNHLGKGRIKAYSAGSKPLGRLNAGAVALLHRHGIDTTGYFSKSWDVFENQAIDIAITVCDNAAGEVCPLYLDSTTRAHWGLSDPGHVQGTPDVVEAAFEATYRAMELRINNMLALPLEEMDSAAISAELNAIGKLDS